MANLKSQISNGRLQAFAESFVASTRDHVFIRPEDNLLILRPNRVQYLNKTGTEMLHALYSQEMVDVAALVAQVAGKYGVPEIQVEEDLDKLLRGLALLLKDKAGCAPAVKMTPFGS
ncbi:MAG: PqqD family protein, partial [Anaerolineae bacterium]|nr:PqqD family protein [Anaerolineae bacterium]